MDRITVGNGKTITAGMAEAGNPVTVGRTEVGNPVTVGRTEVGNPVAAGRADGTAIGDRAHRKYLTQLKCVLLQLTHRR